jgi:hypothetical protein
MQDMFPKSGLLVETKGGGKEEKNDSNVEIPHIWVATRHNEMHQKLLRKTGWGTW